LPAGPATGYAREASASSSAAANPSVGLVTVNNTGSTPCTLEDNSVPGVYWFSYDAGVDNRTLGFWAEGSPTPMVTIQLVGSSQLAVPHVGATPICCFLEVQSYREPHVYRLQPWIRDPWGDTILADSYAVTVHVVDGMLISGTSLVTQSVVSIANGSACTCLGGKYAFLELTTSDGQLLTSPPANLPPSERLGGSLTFQATAQTWFIVDTDEIDGGALYQA